MLLMFVGLSHIICQAYLKYNPLIKKSTVHLFLTSVITILSKTDLYTLCLNGKESVTFEWCFFL